MPRIPQSVAEEIVGKYKLFYSKENPENPTGKSYLDWTSRDLKNMGTRDFDLIRGILADEQYNYIDQILPREMSRAEFMRAILRESARRGIAKDRYYDAFPTAPNLKTQQVTLTRAAYGTAQSLPTEVTELAAVIAIRDASIDMAANNAPAFRLANDLAAKIGKKNDTELGIDTDAAAYDFGYTVGSMPQFKRGDALHIQINSPLNPDQLQERYCPVINNLFQTGRAYENRDAMALGFMQGRIDGRSGFEPTTDRVGLFADCPKIGRAAGR